MHPVSDTLSNPLYDVATSRLIEHALATQQAPHALMAAAGQAVAQLAMAIAPHARHVWVACGPGNNGGDGLVAATALHQLGHDVSVILLAQGAPAPTDALWALSQARSAGVRITKAQHVQQLAPPDLIIDALLGIGANRAPDGEMAQLIAHFNHLKATQSITVLAVDVPSGLLADTGWTDPADPAPETVIASHTLSLVVLRPGLFTGKGRALAGKIWLEDLGATALMSASASKVADWRPCAVLAKRPQQGALLDRRSHNSHKGSWGDVAVVGGASGMQGAAVLAASAALHAGAGRVWLSLLGRGDSEFNGVHLAPNLPIDLMQQPLQRLPLQSLVVVAGCGGGQAIGEVLVHLLRLCTHLVLDADALNTLAAHQEARTLLTHRNQLGQNTVLSPHPKEAARLLGISVDEVQQDRLATVHRLAELFQCTIVLKGSGTLIAAPHHEVVINTTGNGLLAIAGTGDVLAGMLATALAQSQNPFEAALRAVYCHGAAADRWPSHQSLTASALVHALAPLGDG